MRNQLQLMYLHVCWNVTASIGTCEQCMYWQPSLVPRPFPPPAYSMQILRGKAWEIWSHAMTSGRQRVDTGGSARQSPFLWSQPQGSINRGHCVHNARDRSTWNRNSYSLAVAPLCLPSVYLMSQQVTKSPRPSSSVLAYCKDWRWEEPWNKVTDNHMRVLTVLAEVPYVGWWWRGGGRGPCKVTPHKTC